MQANNDGEQEYIVLTAIPRRKAPPGNQEIRKIRGSDFTLRLQKD